MDQGTQTSERRTSVDQIFDDLHDQILSLNLRPGDKISEAEIAARFGVSRQPVRDAFSRLVNLDLIVTRPQRATLVKRFSMREIEKARFIRASVENEVLRRASALCDEKDAALLDTAIAEQDKAILENNVEAFGRLDYEFHKLLCAIAKTDFAFDVIEIEKAKVDRLCRLGLSKKDRMPALVDDHRAIAEAVKNNQPERAVEIVTVHLARLDDTIERISQTNGNYFQREA